MLLKKCVALRCQQLAAQTASDAAYSVSLARAHEAIGENIHPATIARIRRAAHETQQCAAEVYKRARNIMGIE